LKPRFADRAQGRFDSRPTLRFAPAMWCFHLLRFLPCFLACWLGATTFVHAGDSSQPAPRKTVLILGDSLAAGYGLEPDEAFPALLQRKLDAAELNFQIVNAGQSGDTSAGGLRRINWLLRQPVDVLLLELGGNDGLRGISPAATRTNLQQIIERTRERNPSVKLVIAGMRMPDNMGEQFTREFEQVFTGLARENDAALIPFLLAGVGGDPKLNLPDLIHPNAEGHQIVARTVWRVLEPVLRAVEKASSVTSPAAAKPAIQP
jgi:acyl-CoA thioesterase I